MLGARWSEHDVCGGRELLRDVLQGLVDSGEIVPQPVDLLTRVLWAALSEIGLAVADAGADVERQEEVIGESRRLLLGLLQGLRAH